EISHVVQRHGTRAASKQMMAQLPLSLLGGLMGGGALAQMAQLGISFGVGSYFLKNSRQAESEADLLGTDIMYDTGFDPRAMADFFEKIEKEGGPSGPQFLSDHPNPGNRRAAVTKEVNELPHKQSYRSDSPEFLRVKQTVGSMHGLTAQQIADQQKQGTAEGGGVSQEAIAYGVMINGYQAEGNANLDAATHQLIASLRQSNPDLREIGHDEDIRVNGMAAKSVDMIGTSPGKVQGGRAVSERDWLVTFQRSDGNLLYLVFISPDQDFGKLRPTFEEMLKSVHLK